MLGERVSDDEEVLSSNDEVVIYTHEGKHVETKRKGQYMRGTPKTMETKLRAKKKMKVVRHTTLTFDVKKCQKKSKMVSHVLQKEVLSEQVSDN